MILKRETISAMRSALHYSIYDAKESLELSKKHNLDDSPEQLKRFESALQDLEKYNEFRIGHNVKIKANKEVKKFMSENGQLSDKSRDPGPVPENKKGDEID